MTTKITMAELDRRRSDVIERLARTPSLTMNHFKDNLGYNWNWLKTLKEDGIKFGKPVRKHLSLGKK